MQGYRIHFAASLAITVVFLICALSAVLTYGTAAESAVESTTKEAGTSLAASTRAGTLEVTPVNEVDAADPSGCSNPPQPRFLTTHPGSR